MLSKEHTRKQVEYWLKNSEEKLITMKSLYNNNRYVDALFFGHLVLESVLKGLVVLNTKEFVVKNHNLLMLSEEADISLTKEEIVFLSKVNAFNLETRYPDERLDFYKICNKKYIDDYYQPIIDLYIKLCQKVKL